MRPINVQRSPTNAAAAAAAAANIRSNPSVEEGWEAVLEVPSKTESFHTFVGADASQVSVSHDQRDDDVHYVGSRDDVSEAVGEGGGDDAIEVRCVDEERETFNDKPIEFQNVLSETTPEASNTNFLADQLSSDCDKSDEEGTIPGTESDCEPVASVDENENEIVDPPTCEDNVESREKNCDIGQAGQEMEATQDAGIPPPTKEDTPPSSEDTLAEIQNEDEHVPCTDGAISLSEGEAMSPNVEQDEGSDTSELVATFLQVDTEKTKDATCEATTPMDLETQIPVEEDSETSKPLFDPIFFDEFTGAEDEETKSALIPKLADNTEEAREDISSNVDCSTPEDKSVTHEASGNSKAKKPASSTAVEESVINGIIDLIEKGKWAELVELLNMFPSVASVALSTGSSYFSTGDRGNLILHEACKNDPPIAVIAALLNANEGASRTRGQWGYLPLHYACTSGASAVVVEALLTANPEAVMGTDCNGMLPLHLACKWGAPEAVLMALLKAYPDGAMARDNFGQFPLEYAMSNPSLDVRSTTIACLNKGPSLSDALKAAATRALEPNQVENDDDCVVKIEVAENASEAEGRLALENEKVCIDANELIGKRRWGELVAKIQSHPHVASVSLSGGSSMFSSGSPGNLALHEVCKNDPPREVVEVIVEANIDAVKARGRWGYLPLHYACTSGASVEVVQYLIELYPEAVTTMDDNDQMLPLHLACKWGASQDMLKVLLESNTEATTALDAYGKTPMDYASSLSSETGRAVAVAILEGKPLPEEEIESATVVFTDEPMPDPHLLLETADSKSVSHVGGYDGLAAILQQELSEEVSKTLDLGMSMDEQEHAFKVLLQCDKGYTDNSEESRYVVHEAAEVTAKFEQLDRHYADLEVSLAQDLAQSMASEADKQAKEGLCTALLESELMLQTQASTESLLYQPSQDVPDGRNSADNEVNLEAEQQRVAAMEDGLGQMQAILLSGQNKLQSFEEKQSEKQAILESAKSKVAALDQTLAEKELVLESARVKLETLTAQKVERQSMLEAERKKVDALDKTQSEMQSILDKERTSLKTIEQTLAQTKEMLDEEQRKLESVDEPEETKPIVQGKTSALSQSLEANQEIFEAEQAKVKRHEETLALQQGILALEQKKVAELEVSQASLHFALHTGQESVQELANAQAEKQALLEADRKIVEAIEASHAEKMDLLESEKAKMKQIEKILAEKEVLLASEREKVMSLEQTVAKKQLLLELEEKTVNTLEHTIARRDALLELEKEKVENLEVVQAEKRALLESEEEMLHVIASKHAEKKALLESEELVAVDLQRKKKQTEALLESEEIMVHELEQRQAESKALLEAEQELVKTLEETRAQREALELSQATEEKTMLQSNQKISDELRRRHEESEALLLEEVAMAKALERTQIEKQALELAQAEKQALLESEEEMLRAIADKHAEKKALLESEEVVANNLERKKKETEALLVSEQKMAEELERRQSERRALLDAEHEMVQALVQARAAKHTLLGAETDSKHAAAEARLVISEQSALLRIAKQKAGILLRSTFNAPRFLQEAVLASTTAKKASSVLLNASSRMVKKPLGKFVVYCNGFIGLKSKPSGAKK